MLKAGLPSGIANQLHGMYSNLKRYICIVGTYGAVIEQANGVGQGCSISIVIPNLYVATLFRFLRASFPNLQMGAFLDDRNLTTESEEEFMKAMPAITTSEKQIGHSANLGKSVVLPKPLGSISG